MSVATPLYEVRTVQRFDLFHTRVRTSNKVRVRRTVRHRVPMPIYRGIVGLVLSINSGTPCIIITITFSAPSCPWTHPFAFNGGKDCCHHFKKKNDVALNPACDGSTLTPDDPLECCSSDNYASCPDNHLPCQNHPASHRYCPTWTTSLGILREENDLGYHYTSSDSIDYADAKSTCAGMGGKLPSIKTRNDMKGINLCNHHVSDASRSFWVDLIGDPANPVASCLDAACDNNNLYWEGDGSIFDSSGLFEEVDWTWSECARVITNEHSHEEVELKTKDCADGARVICVFDCSQP